MSEALALKPTTWNQLMPRGGRADVVAVVIVLAIVIAMILPVPVWLLDVLIAINVCTAALMVVVVMQIKDSVSLSAFPTLVLITTLFRVSINVASTRLTLLEGEAGHIIEAFGAVVVGGNLVVGLVVFLILTVIQFLVITKGSERVAEVGARFTLDAMPGKQLAIDIELKAGTLTAEQARTRRAQLSQESQFFGAMDGAMKFVKGDAIAGIIITITNLLGGFLIGVVQKGMTAGQSMHVYAILSIGDALVAQLPALMMSLTAGLLITRVANSDSEDGPRNMGKELASQLMSKPKSWVTASAAMMAFGFIPGMPTAIFLGLGAGALTFGLKTIRKEISDQQKTDAAKDSEVIELREFNVIRPFVIRFGSHLQDLTAAQKVLDLARNVRNDLVTRYALVAPAIDVEYGVILNDADFEFCHDEVRVLAMCIEEHLSVVDALPSVWQELDITPERVESALHHVRYRRAWVIYEDAQRLSQEGYVVKTYMDYLSEQIRETLHMVGPAYVGIDQVQKMSKWLSMSYPDLAKEVERAIPPLRVADIFQRLLRERVSLRNLWRIYETLADWTQRERDPLVLCECIRSVLGREICNVYAVQRTLHAFTLEYELEDAIRGAVRQTSYGDLLTLDEASMDFVLNSFAEQFEVAVAQGEYQPVILCQQDIRVHVLKFFSGKRSYVPVISFGEVPPDFKIRVLGSLALKPADATSAS